MYDAATSDGNRMVCTGNVAAHVKAGEPSISSLEKNKLCSSVNGIKQKLKHNTFSIKNSGAEKYSSNIFAV